MNHEPTAYHGLTVLADARAAKVARIKRTAARISDRCLKSTEPAKAGGLVLLLPCIASVALVAYVAWLIASGVCR